MILSVRNVGKNCPKQKFNYMNPDVVVFSVFGFFGVFRIFVFVLAKGW